MKGSFDGNTKKPTWFADLLIHLVGTKHQLRLYFIHHSLPPPLASLIPGPGVGVFNPVMKDFRRALMSPAPEAIRTDTRFSSSLWVPVCLHRIESMLQSPHLYLVLRAKILVGTAFFYRYLTLCQHIDRWTSPVQVTSTVID